MLKEVNIHHQEGSSKGIPCLSLARLTGILTLGNFPVRDAKRVKERY